MAWVKILTHLLLSRVHVRRPFIRPVPAAAYCPMFARPPNGMTVSETQDVAPVVSGTERYQVRTPSGIPAGVTLKKDDYGASVFQIRDAQSRDRFVQRVGACLVARLRAYEDRPVLHVRNKQVTPPFGRGKSAIVVSRILECRNSQVPQVART